MTRDEIKNTPELVDFMLDESVIADSREKLRKRLEEVCDLAVKALEQEPKQVEIEGDGYAYGTDEIVYDFGKCPNCGWRFEEGDKDWEEPHCCHCGQKLRWFDNEIESEDKE